VVLVPELVSAGGYTSLVDAVLAGLPGDWTAPLSRVLTGPPLPAFGVPVEEAATAADADADACWMASVEGAPGALSPSECAGGLCTVAAGWGDPFFPPTPRIRAPCGHALHFRCLLVDTRSWQVGCPVPGCVPRRAPNPEAAGFAPFRFGRAGGAESDGYAEPFPYSESDGHDSDASMVRNFVRGIWGQVVRPVETIMSDSEADAASEPEGDSV
jgi:hypothetical protein